MNITSAKIDHRKESAAQNAREGLITVFDLSLLTGIPVAQLSKFAKTEQLEHFGEYHGKRFYNFQTIVNWAIAPGDEDSARTVIRKGMETELLTKDCPYSIEKIPTQKGAATEIKLSWKLPPAA